jgi:hypothetical protein
MDNFILWILFAASCGVMEAFFFHGYIRNVRPMMDIHKVLTIHRVVVFMCIFRGFDALVLLIPAVITFPFIHDGIYYMTRNILNPVVYRKSFFDQSRDTSAKFSYSFFYRALLFVTGCAAWVMI